MQVRVVVTGDKQLISKLTALGPKLSEFSAAFAILGKELTDYYAGKGFASQGGIFGESWKQLSPVYASKKGRNFPGRGILVASGTMQRNFSFSATPTTLTIGNDTPYFKYHQSTEPRSKMPRRASMGVNSEVKSIVKTVLEADIRNKIRAL
jgi:phage gpG-like protein